MNPTPIANDRASWNVKWMLEKFHEDEHHLVGATPYETRHIDGNLLVTTGIQLLEDLLIAAGGTAFNNANARIGVGDSSTAAAIGQTDLVAATNKVRVAMDATFPSRSGTTISFKSTFGSAVANWVWNEWAIFNAASAGTMLNRKVESLGTKASGSSWVLTCTIVVS